MFLDLEKCENMEIIKKNEEEILHYIMTFMGGFMGLYALCAFENYGSAQTGNLMNLVINLVDGNIRGTLIRVGAFVLFCTGIAVSWLLYRFFTLPMREISLLLDAVGLAISAFMPDNVDHYLRLYPLFVVTSFQWGTFNRVGKNASASLFITGNLKNCVHHWLRFLVDHEREALTGARIYTITILGFLAGGYAGCVVILHIGFMGVFYGYIPLAAAEIIILTGKETKLKTGIAGSEKIQDNY
ncbi:YoaK family protein [Lachnospiraceae bacterium 54-53]